MCLAPPTEGPQQATSNTIVAAAVSAAIAAASAAVAAGIDAPSVYAGAEFL